MEYVDSFESCSACHKAIKRGYRCWRCRIPYCEECGEKLAVKCTVCDGSRCPSCVQECNLCQSARVCIDAHDRGRKVNKCYECGEWICSNCVDTERCSTCKQCFCANCRDHKYTCEGCGEQFQQHPCAEFCVDCHDTVVCGKCAYKCTECDMYPIGPKCILNHADHADAVTKLVKKTKP